MKKKIGLIALGVIVGGFAILQAVPYGRDHENPPVDQEPAWDSPATRDLAQRACFDCHSNETTWPWYSHIAPVSWLVQHDVEEGREHLNFSDWAQKRQEIHEAAEEMEEGEMPMPIYLVLHSEAKLSPEEQKTLMDGLNKLAADRPRGEKHHHDEHEH